MVAELNVSIPIAFGVWIHASDDVAPYRDWKNAHASVAVAVCRRSLFCALSFSSPLRLSVDVFIAHLLLRSPLVCAEHF